MATPATVYAKAFFDVSQKGGNSSALAQELKQFWDECMASKPLHIVLCEPGTNAPVRRTILKEISSALSLGELSSRFLLLLSERGRIQDLPGILAALDQLIDGSMGICSGELRTAIELGAEDLTALSAALSKRVGAKVKLAQEVDADLLGGFVASVGGKTYDASLKSQLQRFKSELI